MVNCGLPTQWSANLLPLMKPQQIMLSKNQAKFVMILRNLVVVSARIAASSMWRPNLKKMSSHLHQIKKKIVTCKTNLVGGVVKLDIRTSSVATKANVGGVESTKKICVSERKMGN